MGFAEFKKSISDRISKVATARDESPEATLCWLGKLPLYEDYYRGPFNGEWQTEFENWLMNGQDEFNERVKQTKRKGSKVSDRVFNAEGLVRLKKSRMSVVFTVRDYGGDATGYRKFPFVFYAGFPTKNDPGPTAGDIAALSLVFAQMRGLWDDMTSFFKRASRLQDYFINRVIDVSGLTQPNKNGDWTKAAMALPMGDWFSAAKSILKTKEPAVWVGLVDEWGERIRQHAQESNGLTLRFPIATDAGESMQIAGWLSWLRKRSVKSDSGLSIFLSQQPSRGPSNLTVISRELAPEDYLLLTPVDSSVGYLDEISSLEPPEVESEIVADVGDKAWDPTVPWGQFVGV